MAPKYNPKMETAQEHWGVALQSVSIRGRVMTIYVSTKSEFHTLIFPHTR